jgi:acyl-CoA dehydrogenase
MRDGGDYVINGTKHFISHADLADFVILFAVTGAEQTSRGQRNLITALLVDRDTPRLTVAATCVGRARRVLEAATEWAATRVQFGQPIGKFQGVGFQLADMTTALEAAELLTLRAATRLADGRMRDADAAMAKVYASETLGWMTETAVQIFGGMELMSELPIERWWRDARVERIWDGTSEIQRHIIARSLLAARGR